MSVDYLNLTQGEQQIRNDMQVEHARECEECDKVAELEDALAAEREAREKAEAERDRFRQWVHDCQAGMYINCVYCGHRYGPDDEVPATMADVLKEHIEQCPEHPMSALKKERDELRARLEKAEKDAAFQTHTADCEHAFREHAEKERDELKVKLDRALQELEER